MKKNTFIASLAFLLMNFAQAEVVRVDVRPSTTAPEIKAADSPHIVLVDAGRVAGDLLLWMPGTLGRPHLGAQFDFPQFAAQQGYRVIILSYITDQAVSGICVGKNLRGNRSCAEDFRRKRIFGDLGFSLIADQAQDAIQYRFTQLLQYLKDTRQDEHWEHYLNADGSPRWERIAVGGQSQGGGHAAFIAQTKPVARVIMLSGGWDISAPGEIADWYTKPNATQPKRWFATYHVEEPTANLMAEIYRALRIPAANVGVFEKPVRGAKAHGEGLSNSAYQSWWKFALGRAASVLESP
ncbi:BPSS1187 family protein [Undibacterium sp. Ji22W]|uniref:BPSS1187 family protein n=1 Tax=Undibacterium sp. Ji22W TaxID=3413038 RepID=UPI003BF43281